MKIAFFWINRTVLFDIFISFNGFLIQNVIILVLKQCFLIRFNVVNVYYKFILKLQWCFLMKMLANVLEVQNNSLVKAIGKGSRFITVRLIIFAAKSFSFFIKHHARETAHGVMDFQINSSWWFHWVILVPAVFHYYNKGHCICYPICGMVHIKDPLLLIGTNSLWSGRSGFPFSQSVGSLPYVQCHMTANKRLMVNAFIELYFALMPMKNLFCTHHCNTAFLMAHFPSLSFNCSVPQLTN